MNFPEIQPIEFICAGIVAATVILLPAIKISIEEYKRRWSK